MNSEFTAPEAGEYVLNFQHSNSAALSVNFIADNIIINDGSLYEHVESLYNELKNRIGPYDVFDNIVRGDIVINTSGWQYRTSDTRVCTKEGYTIPLKAGDKINLRWWVDGDKDVQMYVGWRLSDGTYGTSGGWVNSEFTAPEAGEYVLNFKRKNATSLNVDFVLRNIIINDGSLTGSVRRWINDDVLGGGNSPYYGASPITFVPTSQEHSCNVETIISQLYANGGSLTQWTQSMAIFNGKIFLFLDTAAESAPDAGYSFVVIDLASKAILYRGNTPTRACHNNNAQFLDIFYDEGDTYPLLLLSRGDYPSSPDAGKCYIVRIVENDGAFELEIIKTISCTMPQAKYNGSWVTDRHGNLYLYTMTIGDYQTPESAGNRFVIYRFDMFNPLDGVDITLSASDVKGMSVLDYCVLQGGDSFGGKLFLPIQSYTKINGVTPAYTGHIVAVIDPIAGCVENMIPSDTLENEGVCIYEGKMYVSSKDGNGSSSTTTPTFKIQAFSF